MAGKASVKASPVRSDSFFYYFSYLVCSHLLFHFWWDQKLGYSVVSQFLFSMYCKILILNSMFIFVYSVFHRIILFLIFVREQKNQIACYFSSGWNVYGLGSALLDFKECRNSLELGTESVEPRTRVFFSWKLYFCMKGIIWCFRSLWKLCC